MSSVEYILLPLRLLRIRHGHGWWDKKVFAFQMSASERVILNGRDDDAKTVETTAKTTATATDLMNRLNRIMTSLKADHIQASKRCPIS